VTSIPPIPPGAGRRRVALVSVILGALVACGGPAPSVAPGSAGPSVEPESAGPTAASASPPLGSVSPAPASDASAGGADGLLVASGDPLEIITATGQLAIVPGSPSRASAVGAGGGRTVVVDLDGSTSATGDLATNEPWQTFDPTGRREDPTALIAVSPDGRRLAMILGQLQGAGLEVAVTDLRTGRTRLVRVQRGVNGPPAWLGPSTVVLDAIDPAGRSSLTAVDVDTGAVTDDVGPGIEISASGDASLLVGIDRDGTVLVVDTAAWRLHDLGAAMLLPSTTGETAEHVAMSPDGGRVAVIRTSESGPTTIDIWRLAEATWTKALDVPISGDGRISIAWAH
jgi:hypothetical protein